jgi:hypothetical protein
MCVCRDLQNVDMLKHISLCATMYVFMYVCVCVVYCGHAVLHSEQDADG